MFFEHSPAVATDAEERLLTWKQLGRAGLGRGGPNTLRGTTNFDGGTDLTTDVGEQLWGGETSKAVANFPVSGERVPAPVVR